MKVTPATARRRRATSRNSESPTTCPKNSLMSRWGHGEVYVMVEEAEAPHFYSAADLKDCFGIRAKIREIILSKDIIAVDYPRTECHARSFIIVGSRRAAACERALNAVENPHVVCPLGEKISPKPARRNVQQARPVHARKAYDDHFVTPRESLARNHRRTVASAQAAALASKILARRPTPPSRKMLSPDDA
jgi:hypothetical protein